MFDDLSFIDVIKYVLLFGVGVAIIYYAHWVGKDDGFRRGYREGWTDRHKGIDYPNHVSRIARRIDSLICQVDPNFDHKCPRCSLSPKERALLEDPDEREWRGIL